MPRRVTRPGRRFVCRLPSPVDSAPRDHDESRGAFREGPPVEVSPQRIDRETARRKERPDLPRFPGSRDERRLHFPIGRARATIAVTVAGFPQIRRTEGAPGLADVQHARRMPDPPLEDLGFPAPSVESLQNEPSARRELMRDAAQRSPAVRQRGQVGERIARRHHQVELAIEADTPHVGRDEAGARRNGPLPSGGGEHRQRNVDSDGGSMAGQSRRDTPETRSDLEDPPRPPLPSQTSPERKMRARDRLLLVEGEYPFVVAPDLVETLAPRHDSRYIPVAVARLLFVTGTSPNVRSGSGTFVGISVLCEALRAGGHTVELLAPREGGGPVSLSSRLLFNLRARKAAQDRCPDPDAIIGFDLDGLFLPRGRARRIAAIKGGAAEEASFERGPARLRLSVEAFFEKRHVRGADRILTPSAHTAGRIVSDYGIPRDRITVVPEPIDLARWRTALAAAPDRPRGPVSILCVAHLYPRKDVATLLGAMARLAGGAVLRVVGTGPALAGLERRARETELNGRVEFLGHLPFDRLAAEYRRADLFCLPSRQEGFGIVFLEAMAAGLPVVAVRAAAIPEVVADGVSGVLVPPGDAVALANALERLIADPGERRRLSEEGRRRVRSYDAPDVAVRFLEAIGLESARLRRLETRRRQS